MNAQQLVSVRSFLNEFQAQQTKNWLEANAVPAYVEGANTVTTLSYIGSAIGSIKVMVHRSQAQQAEQILAQWEDQPPGPEWQCGHCYSQVDAGFDVCWKCGEPPQALADGSAATEGGGTEGVTTEAVTVAEPEASLPAASMPKMSSESWSPQLAPTVSMVGSARKQHLSSSSAAGGLGSPANTTEWTDGHELLDRAWRAAILGCVIVPGIAHLYSLALLIRLCASGQCAAELRTIRFWAALTIDLLVLLTVALWVTIN